MKRGAPPPPLNQATSPYRQSYTYDEWNNVTLRTGRIWWTQNEYETSYYTNDNKNAYWGYDAAGNATFTGYGDGTRTYDVAGRPVTFTSQQNWQVWPDWPSGHPDAPALETQDTFDGSGQVVKHVNHTRHDDSYDGGYGLIYTMSDTTTTTYYVRSTVLGGQAIAELDQYGYKTTGYVYAGGARLAKHHVWTGGSSVEIESTNPVTGAAFTTDANGNGVSQQEPDPLGRDLTTLPDPTVVVDPLASSKWNDPMPIEASWGPSQEHLQGNAWWAGQMGMQQLTNALENKFKATAQLILEKNPNVGVRTRGGVSLYGNDAADYLNRLHGEPFSGTVISSDPLGFEPQNTVTAPLGDLRGNLEKILKQGKCEEYTTKLLAEAAKRFAGNYPHVNTIMEGYERINSPKGGGYILKQVLFDTVDGDLFANGARPGAVWLVPNRQYGSMTDRRIAEFQADYAWTALHETFHLATQGGYDDEQLATAAFSLAGKALPETPKTGLARVNFYSEKFDEELLIHCPKLR